MLAGGVHHLFVAVDGQVVVIAGNVSFWYAKALVGAAALQFAAVALAPARQHIGQVIFGVLCF